MCYVISLSSEFQHALSSEAHLLDTEVNNRGKSKYHYIKLSNNVLCLCFHSFIHYKDPHVATQPTVECTEH
jgi:hypothetical protein